ncbi:MAG: alpha/beta fold hydrolase [Polyangiaceae bacterium]|nr:alpha/beta fold hydrolase [Polyangiaceae bacterium]
MQLELGGGARVESRQWSCDAPRASILVLPALGIRASYYQTLAASLAARRLSVTTADLRGHGEHSVRVARGVSFGYAALVDDVLAVARQLKDKQPSPLFLLGHSLGGQLGLLASGAAPELFAGVVLVASGTPYHRGYPPRDARRIRLLARLIPLLTGVVGYYPGERVGFGGRESAGLMRDWARLALEGRFSVQGRDPPAWLRAGRAPSARGVAGWRLDGARRRARADAGAGPPGPGSPRASDGGALRAERVGSPALGARPCRGGGPDRRLARAAPAVIRGCP